MNMNGDDLSFLDDDFSLDDDLFLATLSILIIDGDDAAREETRGALAQVGAGADAYGDPAQAMEMIRLRHARRQEYDLILVDRSLPGKSGAEMIREILELLGDGTTTIFLTAGDGSEADGKSEARSAGANAFLLKPLSSENIMQAFRNVQSGRPNHGNPLSHAALDGRRVLVAEDMTVNAEIIKQLLSMNFVKVDHAKNGKEAVELFTKSPKDHYDAILMDVRMPVMDGLTATAAIRASDHPNAKTVPIIALTTNYFDEDVQRSLAAGMDAHLEKPAEPDQIYRTLAELIRKRK